LNASKLLKILAVGSASSARRNFLRWREQYKPVRERLARNSNAAIHANFFFGKFLGVVSAPSARRNFLRYREQYKDVRERFAENFNAAIGVLTASKNGGYALI